MQRTSRFGWLGLRPYTATLKDLSTGATADIANIEVAEQIADLLDRAEVGALPTRVKSDALWPRYESFRDPQDRTLVARFYGAYPERVVVRTEDRELAERLPFS